MPAIQSCLVVIPAKAGIQFEYVVRSTQDKYVVSCGRIFRLDSGLRRNDGLARWVLMASSGQRIAAGSKPYLDDEI